MVKKHSKKGYQAVCCKCRTVDQEWTTHLDVMSDKLGYVGSRDGLTNFNVCLSCGYGLDIFPIEEPVS